MSELPSGTITFLFTDIEGSTNLLKQLGADLYGRVLADHRFILRTAFEEHNGSEIDTQGDSFFVSFQRASDAVAAVVQIQRALADHEWLEDVEVRVRMGLHTGEPLVADEGYVGMDVHRAARIAQVGHGGQVLLSSVTTGLLERQLPDGVGLRDLGTYQLKDLQTPNRLYQLIIDRLPSDFPPLKISGGRVNNLPPQTTSFVGRQEELETLDNMLANKDIRLVTLVGPGGMGKTRLALAVAEQQLEARTTERGKITPRFPDGVFFVPLASINQVVSLVGAIAEALGFHLEGGTVQGMSGEGDKNPPRMQLLDYLRTKRLLLVLDNFEHLLDGAGLVAEIIEMAPGLQVMATSRERLKLQGEHTVSLQGMRYPPDSLVMEDRPIDEYPAIELFVHRTKKRYMDFELKEDEIGEVAEICRLAGGMPLAIELAAAWVAMLSLKEIKAEIQGSLNFLESDLQDVPERHRSMRAVMDATWIRLSEQERQIFRNLSVYRGGFTREAAGQVAAADLRTLTTLADKSLIRYSRRHERYEIHELLRQYGADKLAENSVEEREIRDRHSNYYCGFLGAREDELKGERQMAAQREIEGEFDNILEAWRWVLTRGNHISIQQAVVSLGLYIERALGDEEGEATFHQAMTLLESGSQAEENLSYLRVVPWWAQFVWGDQHEKAELRLRGALRILEDVRFKELDLRAERASILFALGAQQMDSNETLSFYTNALTIYKEIEANYEIGHLLLAISSIYRWQGNFKDARDSLESARVYLETLGDELGLASCYQALGNIDALEGNPETGEVWFRNAISVYEKFGHHTRIPPNMYYLAFNLSFQGKFAEAESTIQEGLVISREMGLPDRSGYPYLSLAYCYLSLGEYSQAMADARLAYHKDLEIGASWRIAISRLYMGQIEAAQDRIPEAREHLEESLSIFNEISQPIGTPDAFATLAWIYLQVSEMSEMEQNLRTALELSLETRVFTGIVIVLAVIALRSIQRGEIETGIEYYALASTYPAVTKSRWFHNLFGHHIEAAAEGMPTETIIAAETRGQARNLWETARELLAELR